MKRKSSAFHRALGARLRVARLALGISEETAAAALGRKVETYRRYEAGENPGRLLCKFVQTFNVSFDWLLEGEGGNIGRHLAEDARGTIAILPTRGPVQRRFGDPHRPGRRMAAPPPCKPMTLADLQQRFDALSPAGQARVRTILETLVSA